MGEQDTADCEVLEILVGHCRTLARSRDPHRRIAASKLELQLMRQLQDIQSAAGMPIAASFSQRADDPGATSGGLEG